MNFSNNLDLYKDENQKQRQDYRTYLKNILVLIDTDKEEQDIKYKDNTMYQTNFDLYKSVLEKAIVLGPDNDIDTKIYMLFLLDNRIIPSDNDDEYGKGVMYKITDEKDEKDYLNKLRENDLYIKLKNEFPADSSGGSRRNKATPKSKAKPKHDEMTMKDIKEMCKANEIKLSKVVEGKRVAFKKKELITKLKRKKLL